MKSNRPVNVEVRLKPNESADRLIKRFLKKCKKTEIIKEHLEKVSYFRSPSQKRKFKRMKNQHLQKKEMKKFNKFTQ